MREKEIELLFSYHPPDETTTPLYMELREAWGELDRLIDTIQTSFTRDGMGLAEWRSLANAHYAQVNAATVRLARAGVLLGDDRFGHHGAGVIALTLTRNALNEAIATRLGTGRLLAIARTEAQKARWLFSSHIAVAYARRNSSAVLTP